MTSRHSVWQMTSDLTLQNIRLTEIRAADGGAVLCFTVEYSNGRELVRKPLCAFSARLSRLPVVGALDAARFEELCHEDEVYRAICTGLRALAGSDPSAAQLRHKLRASGNSAEVTEEAIQVLEERGYINEVRGALCACERELKKLRGDRRILAELRAKGYGDEGLAAVRERLAEQDAVERCRALLRKKRIKVPEEQREMQKLIAALVRYGYAAGEIRAALQVDIEDFEI